MAHRMGFHDDGQAGLELLTSGAPPTSASQSARITGMSHHARLSEGLHRGGGLHFGRLRWVDHLKPRFQDQLGQHGETWSLLKIQKVSWTWWHMLVIPATWEAEALELLEPRRQRLQFKQFCFSLPSSWDYRHLPSCLIFVFLIETAFHHVDQAGLKLLTSSYPSASAFPKFHIWYLHAVCHPGLSDHRPDIPSGMKDTFPKMLLPKVTAFPQGCRLAKRKELYNRVDVLFFNFQPLSSRVHMQDVQVDVVLSDAALPLLLKKKELRLGVVAHSYNPCTLEAKVDHKLLARLRQENRLNPGGGGCSEPRSRNCTPARVTGQDAF
ncbi:Protein GVQW1 [Plecturocebus cupreus]